MEYTCRCPNCDTVRCFANDGRGKCKILTENEFGKRRCPFYKDRVQRQQEKIRKSEFIIEMH